MITIKSIRQRCFKMLIALICISVIHIPVSGQIKKLKISCEELNKLIKPKDGKSPLYRFKLDSIVYFVDPENLLSDCKIKTWNNRKVVIITTGTAINSIRQFDPHGVFLYRPNYFLLTTGHYYLNKSIRFLHL